MDMKRYTQHKIKVTRSSDKDWPYPPNYNHVLGYCEGRVKEKVVGIDPVHIDRAVKDGKSMNK